MTAALAYAIKFVADMDAAVRFHTSRTCQLGFRVEDMDAFFSERTSQGVAAVSPPTSLHGQRIAKSRDQHGAEFRVSGK